MVLPHKQEIDMSELNNETCELSFDELEQVSGGSIINRIVDAYLAAVGKNLMDAIHPPKPKMSMQMR